MFSPPASLFRLLAAFSVLHAVPGIINGQSLSGPSTLRGGGVLQTCDTSMHVDFNTALLDGYACQFTPQIVPGTTQVTSSIWHYFTGSTWAEAYGAPTVPYFGPEPYPICLSVDAFDQQAAQPCSTTVCKLVTPQPYAVCGNLSVGFGIASVQGNSITFVDQSAFPGGQVVGAYWNFGDGSSIASSFTPAHDFSGNGPFRICLTVVGAPPTNCTATLCQWLYMGPGNLPCEQVVHQGFAVLQHNELVGVLDTSLTSGMNTRIDWDFGDGAMATGLVAIHAYQPFQGYELCGTLRVWGPLLGDTCVSTLCQQVFPMAAVGVGESLPATVPLAWPSPFADQLQVRIPHSGGEATLLDGLGRVALRRGFAPGSTVQSLHTADLPPGCYTLIIAAGSSRTAQRVVKQP